jgi:hypothetical protein
MQFNLRYHITKTLLLVFFFSFSFISSYSQEDISPNANVEPATTGGSMTFLPSTLVNWKAALIKNKVQLNWSTTIERNADYYIIEKSTDGKNFTEAGRVDAGINSENRKDYSFTENAGINEGIVYYRLKSADLDGKRRFSDVIAVRVAGVTASTGISTFPNPVINHLNITLPANWSGKRVTVNVYNVNGIMVKQLVKETASKTEKVDVNYLQPGMYIVKAVSGNETAVQQVIK